jgi:hypothetical protein
MLNSMLKIKLRDVEVLDSTADLVAKGKIANVNTITNILYVFAKFQYIPQSQPSFLNICTTLLNKEPVLPVSIVCRNLWNFHAL